MNCLLAFFAATAFILLVACVALNEKQMAGIIHAVHMGICLFTALVAMSNDLISDPFPKTLVEYKVFAVKFIFEFFLFHVVHVIDNSTLQVKYIFESFMEHVR